MPINWNRRYTNEELGFNDMVRQTVQQEAEEKMDHHAGEGEHHLRRAEDHEDRNNFLFHLHTLAARAHDLAFHAWNHVYNNIDNPTGFGEYDEGLTQSLRTHARDATSHASHASMLAESEEEK